MAEPTILSQIDDRGVVTLTLNRPALRNAIDDAMIAELTQEIVRISRRDPVKAIILTGAGDAFCAGTDITWMEHLAANQSGDDVRRLANLLYQLRVCPKPTVARINGPTIGAGVGLAAACDVLVSSEDATFALPAVRLGNVPAVIGPFITEAIGVHQARRYFLTGETMGAEEARRLGLLHAVCMDALLDETVDGIVEGLLLGGPLAIKETKAMINEFGTAPISPALLTEAAKHSARVRKMDEAREGLAAFIEKRDPAWHKDQDGG